MLNITAIYAGLLGLLALILIGAVGVAREKAKVSLGDGGDPTLIVRDRQHMNFVENVPLALILIGLLEANGASAAWVHGLGSTLVFARIIHPFGLDTTTFMTAPRLIGFSITLIVIGIASVKLLWGATLG